MTKKEKGWFKKVLKPTKLKILVFVILLILMMFLPLYPVHVEEHADMNGYVEYENYTVVHSFYTVLNEDYNWVTSESRGGAMPAMVGIWTGSVYYNSADPISIILYIPYSIIMYMIACFLTLFLVWNRKNQKGIKDL